MKAVFQSSPRYIEEPAKKCSTAIFLDRDGVVNHYPGDGKYVTSVKEFRFLPNAKKAIALLNGKKLPLFVISNQAGVSKGIFSRESLTSITTHMVQALKKSGAFLEGVYYCTHKDQDHCSCRKPKAGLIKTALKSNRGIVNLKESFFVGDTLRDVHTAKAAGCKSILVFSGKEKLANRKNWDLQPDFFFPNLYEAAKFIVKR